MQKVSPELTSSVGISLSDEVLTACSKGDTVYIKNLVLNINSDVVTILDTVTNKVGDSPLHCACRSGYLDVIKLLLEGDAMALKSSALVTSYNDGGPQYPTGPCHQLLLRKNHAESVRPFFVACEHGHIDVVIYLRKHYIALGSDGIEVFDERRPSDGMTPFLAACASSNFYVVSFLCDKCKNEIDMDSCNKDGMNALALAAVDGNMDTSKLLIKLKKSDVGRTDQDGNTPIIYAILNNREDVALAILKAMFERQSKCLEYRFADCNKSLLAIACEHGCLKVVKALLARNETEKDIFENDRNGNSPLHLAALNGHVELIEELLTAIKTLRNYVDRGESFAAPNIDGNTPLHLLASAIDMESNEVEHLSRIFKSFVGDEITHLKKAVAMKNACGQTVFELAADAPEFLELFSDKSEAKDQANKSSASKKVDLSKSDQVDVIGRNISFKVSEGVPGEGIDKVGRRSDDDDDVREKSDVKTPRNCCVVF